MDWSDESVKAAFNEWLIDNRTFEGEAKVRVEREIDYGQQPSDDEPYHDEIYVTVDYLAYQTDDPDSQETFRAVLVERDGEEFIDFEEV